MSTGLLDQAMDYIADNDTAKTGAFTKSQGGMTVTLSVKERNGIVSINGALTDVVLTANTSTKVGTISDVGMPAVAIRALCSVGSNIYTAGTISYLYIGTNGEVYITSSNGGSGKGVYFTASYVVG